MTCGTPQVIEKQFRSDKRKQIFSWGEVFLQSLHGDYSFGRLSESLASLMGGSWWSLVALRPHFSSKLGPAGLQTPLTREEWWGEKDRLSRGGLRRSRLALVRTRRMNFQSSSLDPRKLSFWWGLVQPTRVRGGNDNVGIATSRPNPCLNLSLYISVILTGCVAMLQHPLGDWPPVKFSALL